MNIFERLHQFHGSGHDEKDHGNWAEGQGDSEVRQDPEADKEHLNWLAQDAMEDNKPFLTWVDDEGQPNENMREEAKRNDAQIKSGIEKAKKGDPVELLQYLVRINNAPTDRKPSKNIDVLAKQLAKGAVTQIDDLGIGTEEEAQRHRDALKKSSTRTEYLETAYEAKAFIRSQATNEEEAEDPYFEGNSSLFQNNKDLKTKGEHQQRRKCSQCGKSYLGQKNSDTCGSACRMKKSRSK